MDVGDDDAPRTQLVEVVHDAVHLLTGHHRAHGRPVEFASGDTVGDSRPGVIRQAGATSSTGMS